MNIPRLSYSEGTNACNSICTIVTNVHIMRTKAGIRTSSGTNFLKIDITVFDPIRTNVAASPIPIPFIAAVVTAIVGHMPSTSLNVGFSVNTPFKNTLDIFVLLFMITPLLRR